MEETNTQTNPSGAYHYAGFWIRLLAMIIDSIILGVIGYFLFGSEVTQVDMTNGPNVNISYNGWNSLVPLLYTFIFWVWISATPGKYICGIKIIEADGKKLSWQKAILRLVGYLVSSLGLLLGFLWIGFNQKKRGWHDMIAGTYVVKR